VLVVIIDSCEKKNTDPGGHAIGGVAGLNPVEGMDIRLLCLLCCVGSGLCDKLITRSEECACVCLRACERSCVAVCV
jgi:hypothetical protein